MTNIERYKEEELDDFLANIGENDIISIYGNETYIRYLFDTCNVLSEQNISFIIDQYSKWDICNIDVKSPEFIKTGDINYLLFAFLSNQEQMYDYIRNEIGFKGKIIIIESDHNTYSELIREWHKFIPEQTYNIEYEHNYIFPYKLEDIEEVVVNVYYGRSGTIFFQSLLDNHPQILMFPGLYISDFYQFWDVCEDEKLSVNKLIDSFVYYYYYLFDSRCNRGEAAGFDMVGENHNQVLGVDKNEFVYHLKKILDKYVNITGKIFFKAIHVAYTMTKKQDIDKSRPPVIFYHIHSPHSKAIFRLLNDFPKTKIIHNVRNPIQSFASLIRSRKNARLLNINWLMSSLKNIFESIPVSEELKNISYILKLEDIHLNSKSTLESVCNIIKVDWHDNLLKSSFDGLKWWNLKGTTFLSGFNTKIVNKQYNDVMNNLDRFRMGVLLKEKCKYLGYLSEDFDDYTLMNELLRFPFKFEKYLFNKNEKEKYINRQEIYEYLVKQLYNVLINRNNDPMEDVKIIKPNRVI